MRASEQQQFNTLRIAGTIYASACQICPQQESKKRHLCAYCSIYQQHESNLLAQQELANTGLVDFATHEGWA